MYDLNNVAKDFPWTAVTYNAIEPWREFGTNWFDEIPLGWGDVIYQYLVVLDKNIKAHHAENRFITEQVKEKFGGLRWYFTFAPLEGDITDKKYEDDYKWQEAIQDIIWELEVETEKVCCECGTTENVQCYGSWIHFACPECEFKRQEEIKKQYTIWKAKCNE